MHLAEGTRIGAAPTITAKLSYLQAFFPGCSIVSPLARDVDVLAGWGAKLPGKLVYGLAAARRLPVWRLEDGFLRSVGLGKSGAPTVSIAVDDIGIYFDAARSSRLEVLAGEAARSKQARARGAEALELWRSAGLSKYNVDGTAPLSGPRLRIVLVDQVAGDASIAASGADAGTFARMLSEALQTGDAQSVAVRVHPDVLAGKAQGYLLPLAQEKGVRVVDSDVSAASIYEGTDEIWTVSSQFGFEALLRGCKVVCFGMPFYNGWGFCEDRSDGPVAQAARGRRHTRPVLEAFFDAALLRYPHYADPVTKQPVDYFQAVERIRDWRARTPAPGHTVCFNFSAWKQKAADHFFGGPGSKVTLTKRCDAAAVPELSRDATRLAVWGVVEDEAFLKACKQTGLPFSFVEDGFLRSVGLGSDLRMPGSLVIDNQGMYYDATRPSGLETILQKGTIPPDALAQASDIKAYLLSKNITKYNLGSGRIELPAEAAGRRVLLVTEQVPGDAALRLGGGDLGSNLEFLQAVRAENPGSFIIYKEHPDLVAGNRSGRLGRNRLAGLADLVVSEGDIAGLFAVADEVHVMSSLAGFEALLRGLPVTVWGRPFYAGWGLTRDKADFPRRTRRATLEEVLAAAYIVYPLYVDPVSGIPCGVSDYLQALQHAREHRPLRQQRGVVLQLTRFSRWLTGRAAD